MIIGSKIDINKTKDISKELLDENGRIKLFPAKHYDNFSHDEIRYFCWKNARYCIPTQELVTRLKLFIIVYGEKNALEIGAGSGDLGYHLGIRMTDSKLQDRMDIKIRYYIGGQPTIKYPEDVKKLTAKKAIEKYRPKIVIGAWVTAYGDPDKVSYNCNLWGIREDNIIKNVDHYILIGNSDIHGDKPIMSLKHEASKSEFLISRASNPENNCLWIWSKP